MWPILFKIDQANTLPPILAAIYCGDTKQGCIIEFLQRFVNEARELEKKGLPGLTTSLELAVL